MCCKRLSGCPPTPSSGSQAGSTPPLSRSLPGLTRPWGQPLAGQAARRGRGPGSGRHGRPSIAMTGQFSPLFYRGFRGRKCDRQLIYIPTWALFSGPAQGLGLLLRPGEGRERCVLREGVAWAVGVGGGYTCSLPWHLQSNLRASELLLAARGCPAWVGDGKYSRAVPPPLCHCGWRGLGPSVLPPAYPVFYGAAQSVPRKSGGQIAPFSGSRVPIWVTPQPPHGQDATSHPTRASRTHQSLRVWSSVKGVVPPLIPWVPLPH